MYVMKRTTVYLEDSHLDILKTIAVERKTSFSEALRSIIEDVERQGSAKVTLESLDDRLKVVEAKVEQMIGD